MKFYKSALILLLVLMLLVGCASQESTETDTQNDPVDISILGGGPTGLWFMLTNGISEAVNTTYPGSIALLTPGDGTTNLIRVGNHEADFAMMSDLNVVTAKEGNPPFEEKIDNLVAIAGFYPSTFQMVVNADYGISSFDEIIEDQLDIKIAIGAPGSAASVLFMRMLEEYGVSIEDMESWGAKVYLKNFTDSASMLADGAIDGYSLTNIVPAHHFIESALGKDIILVEMNPQIMESLADTYGYSLDTIPVGSYDFQTAESATLTTRAILGASTELSDETAYKLARSIVENVDTLKNVHATLKNITPESLSHGFKVDLHPGALKYYKEIGMIE